MADADRRRAENAAFCEFLRAQIDGHGLSQREIAARMGYEKPHIVSMFKLGETRVPLEKVPSMAEALGVDPVDLFVRVLACYAPDMSDMLRARLGTTGGAAA